MRRGHVVLANLNPTEGHEQSGRRPCVVVSHAAITEHQRFPLITIIPLTSTELTGPLYPVIEPDLDAGLSLRSYVLADQLRSIDKRRIERSARKPLRAEAMASIEHALRLVLGLG